MPLRTRWRRPFRHMHRWRTEIWYQNVERNWMIFIYSTYNGSIIKISVRYNDFICHTWKIYGAVLFVSFTSLEAVFLSTQNIQSPSQGFSIIPVFQIVSMCRIIDRLQSCRIFVTFLDGALHLCNFIRWRHTRKSWPFELWHNTAIYSCWRKLSLWLCFHMFSCSFGIQWTTDLKFQQSSNVEEKNWIEVKAIAMLVLQRGIRPRLRFTLVYHGLLVEHSLQTILGQFKCR